MASFDYKRLKDLFGGIFIANNGFDKLRAEQALAAGRADLIAFGKPFIANPDLVIRLFLNGPLTPVNQETLYGEQNRAIRITPHCAPSLITPALAMSGRRGARGYMTKSNNTGADHEGCRIDRPCDGR